MIARVNPSASVQLLALRGIEGIVNRRFGESVYFNPDEFAGKLGIERSSLTRAIKALAADLPIDYVPPFRGNAVRVNDRSKRSRDLVIDFKALDVRKQREYDKLERMIKYAQTPKCRRAYILGYFGDAEAATCGSCDNCGTSGDDPADTPSLRPIDTDSGQEIILKALSGVARARGRFGKVMVAQMLTGSSSEKMTRAGLANLTTFGILGSFRQPEVAALLDALASIGLIQFDEFERFRATIALTPEGRDYLKGPDRPPVSLTLADDLFAKVCNGGMDRLAPRPAPNEPNSPAESSPSAESAPSEYASDPLWAKLKALRTAWAKELKLSPFMIFPDTTLEALVGSRPGTPHELAKIKGMGPYKLERYGAALIAAITGAAEIPALPPAPPTPEGKTKPNRPVDAADAGDDHPPGVGFAETPATREKTKPIPPPVSPPTPETKTKPISPPTPASTSQPSSPGRPYVSTEEWTWRLLDRGFAPDEAAAIRGLDLSMIVRHASWMARQGKPVAITAFLTPETLAAWDDTPRDAGPPDPEPTPGLWALYLACRKASGG